MQIQAPSHDRHMPGPPKKLSPKVGKVGSQTMAKAFRESCCSGDLEAVMRVSLQREVDLNDKDQIGRTGLMLALLENQKGVASFLLEQESIDINVVGDWGDTALHWVAWRDNRCIAHICYLLLLDPPAALKVLFGLNIGTLAAKVFVLIYKFFM